MDIRSASPYRIAAALLIVTTMACCALSLCLADDSSAENAETEVIASGTCGPSLTWELVKMGRMTIDGSGDMDFSGSGGEPPWKNYMERITTVTVGEDVTSIEDEAFKGCVCLFEVIDLSTTLDIEKKSTSNGYIAYYARNVFQSEDDATVSCLDDEYTYGFFNGDAYLIKYLADSPIVYLPENLNDGEFVICTDFLMSEDVSLLTVPEGILYIEIGAFGDLVFYDETGLTELEISVENFAGATFSDVDGKLVKQPSEDSKDERKMPEIVLYITIVLSIWILIHVIRRY